MQTSMASTCFIQQPNMYPSSRHVDTSEIAYKSIELILITIIRKMISFK